jgi:nicotinic acid phosphoribosyltransferase
MGFISETFDVKHTSPIVTDKYHLTTAYGYWLEGYADTMATFYMFNRQENNRNYTIAAGLEGIIDIVKRWQTHGFLGCDIEFLRSTQSFPEDLSYGAANLNNGLYSYKYRSG